jgi:hypothetical protein
MSFPNAFKAIVASAAVAVLLSACTSAPAYRPAESPGDYGYQETKLEDNRYRISFHGGSITARNKVQDYALLRAAELTLLKGYDWFKTVDNDTSKRLQRPIGSQINAFPDMAYRVCDREGCYYTRRTYAGSLSNYGYSELPNEEFTTTLEILMGKTAERETGNHVYSAAQIVENLKPTEKIK